MKSTFRTPFRYGFSAWTASLAEKSSEAVLVAQH